MPIDENPIFAYSRRQFMASVAGAAAAPGGVRKEIAGSEARLAAGLELTSAWSGDVCSFRLRNKRAEPLAPREVILFEWRHKLPPATRLYAEGFQMLSQTGGTLNGPVAIGAYTDAKHYRLAQPAGATTVYNVLLLSPGGKPHILLAFASSRRFTGRFHLRPGSIQVALDLEQLVLLPGEQWPLEDFVVLEGDSSQVLLQRLAELLRGNHPIELPAVPPQGWCSWVAFAGKVSAEGVLANARAARARTPALRYIQIDGGYMDRLGDWLEPAPGFGGDVGDVLRRIRDLGLEPGLWVAPFIAERTSRVFRQHPSWFMRDESGAPLPADRVTYGGWKRPPWFALDGTHPAVQEYLEKLFAKLRTEWGCTYFKLDANFWGAMHGGRLYRPDATRVEAYRSGMRAIGRGAGNAFLLGCNHPIWPSVGLIHGSRSSNDVEPTWDRVKSTSLENFSRLWQNGRLWWNDPDTVQMGGSLTPDEFGFHLATIHASGGMLMDSDNLPHLSDRQIALLNRMSPPTGGVPAFDDSFGVGRLRRGGEEIVYLLNWRDVPEKRELPRESHDFWTGAAVEGRWIELPPHSARVLVGLV